jgi:hypothetical protein
MILLELGPALVFFADVKHPEKDCHTKETEDSGCDIKTDSEIYREHDEA